MTQELSNKTIQTIQNTAQLVVGNSTEITKRMYEILFSKYPNVRNIFIHKPDNKFMLLAEALSLFVINVNKLNVLMPALELISMSHVEVNVKEGHYPMVGMSLLSAMEDVLGEKADVDFMDAWREAYQYLASILIDMETKMYKEIEN